ncbi:DNA-binding transcriptional regulator, LysR family [Streptoalloteichus tenebrarius]|uniref:DNA-binding transcriptional regulator, LysR family n=1 Tax=Streptoalloteichus tenebrarius (strain ATCC 17920 / DSM 40477 / JCM 4838 / CBS 697.72 / NBRC 16177 / NCIMB 11028 / NRRL B-12390 / A12253. 1 / ISP 5477) TaxID=1933 RepID=A0ABT1HWL5_STRSD|nr:LysR family transcriptional regulator [Streptoalloteichus tenebrarius]MCP2259922.1 DNA-binding transcriptional regulator, LysR family [Streptoalloteichus tenebrarius]BFF03246.1 LysR family transcriptional regulator [Streptoalloteichus tenebrarius]
MSLDVGRLRVLVEVARAGSIAAAAQRMSFTPSALSQQLAKLEREAGGQLLERHPHGVRLTRAGRVLVEHGERVLGELRDAEDAVRAALGERPQKLSIGAFPSAAQIFVPGVLAALRRDHPGVELLLLDLEPPRGYGLVSARELDLLITHRYPGVPLPSARGLRRVRLLTDPLALVLPADHPVARAERVTLGDLAGEEWISGQRGVADRVCLERLAEQAGVRLHVAYETHDYEVSMALVGAGVGVTFVPSSVVRAGLPPGAVAREVHGVGPAREIYLVHRRRPPALVGEVIALLREAVARAQQSSVDS